MMSWLGNGSREVEGMWTGRGGLQVCVVGTYVVFSLAASLSNGPLPLQRAVASLVYSVPRPTKLHHSVPFRIQT